MKRLLFALLYLGVLGTVTGCYVDPVLSGSSSVDVGVGAYVEESGRALARAALGWEFPLSTLSIVERVPSPTMTHVSSRPP
jgi:hypothetical protein